MSYRRCSIPNCLSNRKTVLLHKFPKIETGLQKWVKCINSDYLRNLSSKELQKLYVCHKHFEKSLTSGKSLRHFAYPTLFTKEEIDRGIPNVIDVSSENNHHLIDNCTRSKKHDDHTYSNPFQNTSMEMGHTPNADNNAPPTSRSIEINEDEIEHLSEPSPSPPSAAFSWQMSSAIALDDQLNEASLPPRATSHQTDWVKPPERPEPDQSVPQRHADYSCDQCAAVIVGFRYTCVECADYDLCADCERQCHHAHHYMLRVPRPSDQAEIRLIKDMISDKLRSLVSADSASQIMDWNVLIKEEEDPFDDLVPDTNPSVADSCGEFTSDPRGNFTSDPGGHSTYIREVLGQEKVSPVRSPPMAVQYEELAEDWLDETILEDENLDSEEISELCQRDFNDESISGIQRLDRNMDTEERTVEDKSECSDIGVTVDMFSRSPASLPMTPNRSAPAADVADVDTSVGRKTDSKVYMKCSVPVTPLVITKSTKMSRSLRRSYAKTDSSGKTRLTGVRKSYKQ